MNHFLEVFIELKYLIKALNANTATPTSRPINTAAITGFANQSMTGA